MPFLNELMSIILLQSFVQSFIFSVCTNCPKSFITSIMIYSFLPEKFNVIIPVDGLGKTVNIVLSATELIPVAVRFVAAEVLEHPNEFVTATVYEPFAVAVYV